MLTVEIRDLEKAHRGEAEIEMYCDSAGLEVLLYQLGLLESGESHVHLMSPAWAGNELAEDRPDRDPTTVLVHHLKVTRISD